MLDAKTPILSVTQYRKITKDVDSSDEQIKKRVEYLEALSRNIISNEIKNYVKGKKN